MPADPPPPPAPSSPPPPAREHRGREWAGSGFRRLRGRGLALARFLLRPLDAPGLIVGTLFFAFSLTPSLIPRPFGPQAVVSGLSLALGYGVGMAGRRLWRWLELPRARGRRRWILKGMAAAACLVFAWGFLQQAASWQNDLRTLMGLAPESILRPYALGFLTLLVFSVTLILARLFHLTLRAVAVPLDRVVPRKIAWATGTVLAVALFWTLAKGVVFSGMIRVADASYRQLDALLPAETQAPAEGWRTGSPDSLIRWETLGRQGRNFVLGAPTAAEITALVGASGADARVGPGAAVRAGPEGDPEADPGADADAGPEVDHRSMTAVMDPLRIYVGLGAADTPEARARLALEEMLRVEAFSREVLVLVTPTGTGWVDPSAMEPVEVLFRGNVASVAAQYSYLPSPLSLLVEEAYGAEMARALFLEVYGHWTSLPRDARPRLYLHGLSLGTLNSSRSFELWDILGDPFDGVLWSGPPFRTEAWVQATRDRDAGSPAWLPRFRDGAVLRFMNQDGGLDAFEGPWGPLRIAWLQYASDPITFFSPGIFLREPEWMKDPRGPDVSPDLRWFPLVTALQLATDMAVGGAPAGYGHTYAAAHYLEAWAHLTEPPGWSPSALARLEVALTAREEARLSQP